MRVFTAMMCMFGLNLMKITYDEKTFIYNITSRLVSPRLFTTHELRIDTLGEAGAHQKPFGSFFSVKQQESPKLEFSFEKLMFIQR